MTPQPDLAAFINARLDEDEAAAKAAQDECVGTFAADGDTEWHAGDEQVFTEPHGIPVVIGRYGYLGAAGSHIARHDPARALREVQAMRIVVADLTILAGMSLGLGPEYARRLLRVIAGIWEDHPDYRTWLPVAVTEMPPA
jgi:hypothetical protein